MASTSVDWQGEGVIFLLDVPVNFLLRSGGRTNQLLGSALGAYQYWYFGDVVHSRGLVLNSNVWDALSAVATTLMGVAYFGEEMDAIEWLATGLMLGGLVLLAWHDKQ